MTLKEFKELPSDEQWDIALDYMRDWVGEPQDTRILMEDIDENRGSDILAEFEEYLADQN